MQKRLTLAFDIDGTLIDKFGKLDKNVVSIFQKADKNRTSFIFITGNDINVALDCVKKINEILPEGEKIKPYIATSCGSKIYSPEMDVIFDAKIDKKLVENIVTRVRKEDESVALLYRNGEDNYMEKQPVSKNLLKLNAFKLMEKIKKDGGMKLIEIEKDNYLDYADNIKNMFVVPSSKKYRPAVVASLERITYHTDHKVYNGTYIQIPAVTKKMGLIKILEHNENLKNPDLNMPNSKDYKNVIYFGDGTNDAELLKECHITVARGKKSKEIAIKNAKHHLINLDDFADALFYSSNGQDNGLKELGK